jgi:hypothetical protein
MNYQAFTNDSLTMMYEAARGALRADDAGFFESATIAGALEQMRVDLQFDRRRPPHAGAVGSMR